MSVVFFCDRRTVLSRGCVMVVCEWCASAPGVAADPAAAADPGSRSCWSLCLWACWSLCLWLC